jgi:hypothetical protein
MLGLPACWREEQAPRAAAAHTPPNSNLQTLIQAGKDQETTIKSAVCNIRLQTLLTEAETLINDPKLVGARDQKMSSLVY